MTNKKTQKLLLRPQLKPQALKRNQSLLVLQATSNPKTIFEIHPQSQNIIRKSSKASEKTTAFMIAILQPIDCQSDDQEALFRTPTH